MKLVRLFVKIGFVMDMLRLWPRFFLCLYFAGGWMILRWYLSQDAATWDKSGFVTVYASVLLPMLKWYMENGVDWGQMLPLIVREARVAQPAAPKAAN